MRDGLQAYCRKCSAEYCRQRQEAKAKGKPVRGKAPVLREHERCTQRGEVKPHDQWERDKSSSDGRSSSCRERGAERGRIGCFKRTQGLVPAEPDALIVAQQGVCRICPIAPAEHVDHCHETGRVRGVLCFSCNAALGQFKDRPDAIRRAAAYVEGNAWKPTLVAPGVYQQPS
ncbi:recombination endonuclease VII [Streptomyces sp. WZ.A104]|uniref:endonuclease VII domain-containing protein n=1 Tax=Streptomyces sp. WZ.A104 TaxID=2023771 RepID=UPI000BBC692B|nr:endonuclease VII domain-containing protein [Streptomyces sp. WZ.A104]PCG83374.1 recombination endonuclease VII [Streptomyces sp. WZ.A104]